MHCAKDSRFIKIEKKNKQEKSEVCIERQSSGSCFFRQGMVYYIQCIYFDKKEVFFLKKTNAIRRNCIFSAVFFGLFLLLVFLLCTVDVHPAGAVGNKVGLSHINDAVFDFCGGREVFYNLTEALGLVCLGVMLAMALIGLAQWIRRKRLLSVDAQVLSLAPLYVDMVILYVLFELVEINLRPSFPYGVLEDAMKTSFPSSHTMMALCVFGTAPTVIKKLCRSVIWSSVWSGVLYGLCIVMAVGRLLSGVHWFTDILGSVLLSLSMIFLYRALSILLGKFLAERSSGTK